MSADSPGTLPDTRPLYRLIRRTRALLRSSWVLTGLGFSAGLLLSAALATSLLDLLVPLPTALRLTALLLIVGPAGAALVAGVVVPLCRRLSNVHVARRIEQHLPGIHNRLVSCVDLEKSTPKKVASSAFYRRLFTEALERVRAFRPRRVVDFLRLRRSGTFALSGALAFAIAWLMFSDRLPTALARIGLPFADIPPVSGVTYDVQPGHADALREDPVTFTAEVTSAKGPAGLVLEVEGDTGGKVPPPFEMVRSQQNPRLWTCQLDGASLGDGFKDGFRYRVRGGGTWSKQFHIRLVDRPVVLDVQTAVHFPEYMGIQAPRISPPQAIEVTGPEGGAVEVTVRARGEVARGEVQLLVRGKRRLAVHEQTELPWFDGKLPAGTEKDGTWQWQEVDERNAHTEPPAIGSHGHWFWGAPVGHAVAAGDDLFAYVHVSRKDPPQTILLQWHDGNGWEHGAFWGADLIPEGKAGTISRHPMGPLPKAGAWVRLEVPAAKVGLEGKHLRGMAFKLYGGQCFWGSAGTVKTETPALLVTKSFPLKQVGDDRWAGRFPLAGKGLFRPELRNGPGHPNKPIEERRFVALPDQPPQVVLERPGSDLVLSQPSAPPLTIAAFDDYGLDAITLLFRTAEVGDYQTRTLVKFARPQRSHTFVTPLTEAAALAAGGQLRYRIEAKDRKGQATRTREYVVRVAADANAADKQLDAFDRSQDSFRDRLIQLIAEQKKIQVDVERMEAQYAEALQKARDAELKAQAGTAGSVKPDPVKPPTTDKTPRVDPETAKQLAALQAEIARLAQQQTQNANTAQQISDALVQSTQQARNLQTLPQAVADQMQATQQAFQQTGVQALRELAQMMQRGADPRQGVPDLKGIKQKNDRTSKDLEGIKNRLDALAKARKGLRDDLARALRELQQKMLNETGGLTARELKELHDYLAKLAAALKDLQGKQEELFKKTPGAPDVARAEQEQADLEKALEKALADARNLLNAGKKRKPRRRDPSFPESPYTPEGKEVKVPPKEDDTDEPLPQKDKKAQKDAKGKPDRTAKKPDEKKPDEEDEPLFTPALGGEKPVIDKRFDKKRRPVKRKPGDPMGDAESRKNDLEARQADRMRDLQAAQQSLSSDRQTLAQMMRQLRQAMQANSPQQGQQGQGDQAADMLRQMLQSSSLRQALGMLGRMRQGPPQGKGQQANGPRPPMPGATTGNPDGSPAGGAAAGELARLDPATRAVILKLPPRVREDLLQGMREQGPEGYGPFIEEYFKRLTEAKEPGKP